VTGNKKVPDNFVCTIRTVRVYRYDFSLCFYFVVSTLFAIVTPQTTLCFCSSLAYKHLMYPNSMDPRNRRNRRNPRQIHPRSIPPGHPSHIVAAVVARALFSRVSFTPNVVYELQQVIVDMPEPCTELAPLVVEGDVGDCGICLCTMEKGEKIIPLPCQPNHNHVFHQGCIEPWLRNHRTCPTCRGEF